MKITVAELVELMAARPAGELERDHKSRYTCIPFDMAERIADSLAEAGVAASTTSLEVAVNELAARVRAAEQEAARPNTWLDGAISAWDEMADHLRADLTSSNFAFVRSFLAAAGRVPGSEQDGWRGHADGPASSPTPARATASVLSASGSEPMWCGGCGHDRDEHDEGGCHEGGSHGNCDCIVPAHMIVD